MELTSVVGRLRHGFGAGRTKPARWRRTQLQALRTLLVEGEQELAAALRTDLGKGTVESYASELGFVINEVDFALKHLDRWMRPERVHVPRSLLPARARTVPEPLGVVLVISPWNYPVMLALAPMVGAIAAGNCVVLKPSELAPATSAALARLVPRYLDEQAIAVVEGGVDETSALLEQRFDHIFYTGNGRVGRIVMQAAVRHLTPVTLELGGKSPAIVEQGVDLAATARRLVWGKFFNAGQSCTAPDYVLAIGSARELERHLADAIRAMYGDDPSRSPDYGRIVNERHFDRLTALLDSGRVVIGGEHDRNARYIAPTVLADVPADSPVMSEEIFGPILPVLDVPDLDTALAFINERDKPLALYAFTADPRTRRRVLAETSSGAVGFGLPNAHLTVPGLPFGGVGESGTGRYHGPHSFETFSHTKAVLDKPLTPDTLRAAYPPITPLKQRLIRAFT
ncbi:aldehyde dehydrogenase family protein [Actinomadura rupiterrae]|uniref:aldehyde dehydrogenase family protein n=1 Tax=Actinomadura rupiterrae TaxID=559627 RepID=UPI0020A35118|nr:aldehyde dehydrogenase family protein [Actinomadura rupiterrae]MCP2336115.1 aldehyde dehydrogenase (NAD+) [Actinomadura rupiterrae]